MNIILLHGWGCDSRIWQSIIPFLERYVEIQLVDINSHIEKVLANNNPLAETVTQRVVDSIAKQLPEQSILCGWSLGGMLATQLAARYPQKTLALITLAANAVFVANEKWPEAMTTVNFDQFFSLFQKKPEQALKRFMLLEVHGDKNATEQLQYLKTFKKNSDVSGTDTAAIDRKTLEAGLELLVEIDNTAHLENIGCPALYCFGANDALVPVSAAELIKSKLDNGQKISVLEDSGHLLHYPKEKLLVLLESFFEGLIGDVENNSRAKKHDR